MKVLLINSLDKRYGSTYRFRKIREFFKYNSFKVTYVESNSDVKNADISVKQNDNCLGYLYATIKRALLAFSQDYDLLFVQKFLPFTLPAILMARLRKKIVAVDWDDMDSGLQSTVFRRMIVSFCEKYGPKMANLITTHSSQIAKHASMNSKADVHIVNQGVDFDLFDPLKYSKDIIRDKCDLTDKKIIGYMCTFTEGGARDFDVIADAISRVYRERKDIAFMAIGGGPDEKRIHAIIDSYGIGEITHFMGLLDQNDIPEVLCALDISLVYMRDNKGNRSRVSFKVLESLALNKRVVGKVVGETKIMFGRYLHEAVDEGPLELCKAILKSIEEKEKEEDIRKKLEKDYSWANIKNEFMRYFKERYKA